MNTTESTKRSTFAAERDLDVPFRTSDEKYELLARLAYSHRSLQKTIDAELFRKGWQQRLGILRRQQRAAGIADEDFLHTKRRRERGLPFLNGRRPYVDR